MEFLFVMQLAVSGGVWESGVARLGVRTCRDLLFLTTAGAVVHSFLDMDRFVRGTGSGRFASPPMTYSCGFAGAPAEGNVSRHHSQRGRSCSLVWSPWSPEFRHASLHMPFM